MAVIRDVIAPFELFQPASTDDAIRLLDKYGADALVLAGGLDSMDWLKDRLRRPKAVVDLGQIQELHGIKEADGGLEIGAMTPLTEVVHHPVAVTIGDGFAEENQVRELAIDGDDGSVGRRDQHEFRADVVADDLAQSFRFGRFRFDG